jgi:hypothetical protein
MKRPRKDYNCAEWKAKKIISKKNLDYEKYWALFLCLKDGDLNELKRMVNSKTIPSTIGTIENIINITFFGESVLRIASRYGHLEMVKYLISEGANVNDNINHTPILGAAQHGHLEIVKYLISKGSKFDFVDFFGCSPLSWAAWKGHVDIVKYLYSMKPSMEFDIINERYSNVLNYVCKKGHLKTLKYLISKGALFSKEEELKTISWDVVEFLILKGIEIETPYESSKSKFSSKVLGTPPPDKILLGGFESIKKYYLVKHHSIKFWTYRILCPMLSIEIVTTIYNFISE